MQLQARINFHSSFDIQIRIKSWVRLNNHATKNSGSGIYFQNKLYNVTASNTAAAGYPRIEIECVISCRRFPN